MADKEEWFRRTSWGRDAKEAFCARFKRSRSTFHKAQYLRIQALHLQETRQQPLVEAALDLLAELQTNHPDPSQLAQAHHQRAQCLDILDRTGRSKLSPRSGPRSTPSVPPPTSTRRHQMTSDCSV